MQLLFMAMLKMLSIYVHSIQRTEKINCTLAVEHYDPVSLQVLIQMTENTKNKENLVEQNFSKDIYKKFEPWL